MKSVLMCALLALAASLSAQTATMIVTGEFHDGVYETAHFDVDFGMTPFTGTVDLSIAATSATGIAATLTNLNELNENGSSAMAIDAGSDSGTGTVNLSLTVTNISGMQEFLVAAEGVNAGFGTYSGTLTIVGLTPGSIMTHGAQQHGGELTRIFHRGLAADTTVGTAPVVVEFMVDYGMMVQTSHVWLQASGADDGSVTLDALDGVVATNVDSVSGTGAWTDESNSMTASYMGMRRFRVTVQSASAGVVEWQLLFGHMTPVAPFAFTEFSGSASVAQPRRHLLRVDFGTEPIDTMVRVRVVGSSATLGTEFDLTDVDTLASVGSGRVVGGGPDDHAWFATLDLPAYSGVCEFVMTVRPALAGNITYAVLVEIPGVGQTSITHLATQPDRAGFEVVFDIAAAGDATVAAGNSRTHEFMVDFGATAHAAAFWWHAECTGTGTVIIEELSTTGTPVLLQTAMFTLPGGSQFNLLTGVRSGVVRYRVTMTPTIDADFSWVAVFDSTVSVHSLKKDTDDSDDGCSTGTGTGMLWLLALLAIAAAGVRLHRAKA